MNRPQVFISYSHQDEAWKDRVVVHLGVLAQEGRLEVWQDRQIGMGEEFAGRIEQAIDACDTALLLISADFLNSKFILSREVPRLLQRRAAEGAKVIPVILRPCAWLEVSWLSALQARPRDGKPLASLTKVKFEAVLASLAQEICALHAPPAAAEITPGAESPLDDAHFYDFLSYYYQNWKVAPLRMFGRLFPLAGWQISPEWGMDANRILKFEAPEKRQGPAAFAFYDHKLAREKEWQKHFEDLPTFCLRRFDVESHSVVGGLIGTYKDAVATCDALKEEILSGWEAQPEGPDRFPGVKARLPFRNRLTRRCEDVGVSPLTDGVGRSAAIAVSTLTVFKRQTGNKVRYQAMLAKRSKLVANDPGLVHVMPSGMFQPTTFKNVAEASNEYIEDAFADEWNLRHHLNRELVEEVFNYGDEELRRISAGSLERLPDVQHLQRLLASRGGAFPGAEFVPTAVVVDLLNLRLEICTLLLVHDPEWFRQHEEASSGTNGLRPFKPNFEYEGGACNLLTLWKDGRMYTEEEVHNNLPGFSPARFTTPGAAALWFGYQAVKERLAAG